MLSYRDRAYCMLQGVGSPTTRWHFVGPIVVGSLNRRKPGGGGSCCAPTRCLRHSAHTGQ